MRFQGPALGALLLALACATPIAHAEMDPDSLSGLVLGIGQAHSRDDATGYGTWTVTGTVDAENSFGATVRSSFQCTVVITGDTARTTINKFD